MQKAQFFFHDRKVDLRNRKRLALFMEKIFIKEKLKLNKITYIFCSDNHLISINKEFLKHDFYTDVITFDLSSPGKGVEGEIYISLDRVKDNAKIIGNLFVEELHRVIFHGALHLCGYKDKKKGDILIMRGQEEIYLKLYFH